MDEALFQMGPLKSPKPDGFGVCFYQDYWSIVGEDTASAVLKFLNEGCFDENVNFTHILLIPKVECPNGVIDFIPKSLCNVLYKFIAKILANRLKIVLPDIISYN